VNVETATVPGTPRHVTVRPIPAERNICGI
jgi:hypothetical protein